MNTPDGYEQAAMRAAGRWNANPSKDLKEQIVATWRLTKAHRADTNNGVRIAQLRQVWTSAFADAVDWEFDFALDDLDTF